MVKSPKINPHDLDPLTYDLEIQLGSRGCWMLRHVFMQNFIKLCWQKTDKKTATTLITILSSLPQTVL